MKREWFRNFDDMPYWEELDLNAIPEGIPHIFYHGGYYGHGLLIARHGEKFIFKSMSGNDTRVSWSNRDGVLGFLPRKFFVDPEFGYADKDGVIHIHRDQKFTEL